MARPARSVGRTVDVLNFLGADPGRQYSLTAIANALGLNKATCHAMLLELTAHGIVSRGPHKTYTLGPALVNLGTAAALEDEAPLEIAVEELNAIHDDLNVSCLITRLTGDHIELLVRRDVMKPLLDFAPVGNKYLCRPPYGQEFLAWASRAEVDRWLDRLPEPVREDWRPLYYDRLEDVRRKGYRASLLEDVRALKRLLSRFGDDVPGVKRLIAAIEERAYGPFTVNDYQPDLSIVTRFRAPIFGPKGDVVLAIAIGPFAPHLELPDIMHAVDRLLEGTRRVTDSLHGIVPVPDWVPGQLPLPTPETA
jgi:DNA-binding IclR family transcriptional regulator